MDILQIQNMTLRLGGKCILNRLSVDFWEGHIHALVGPNGAGKSTLANTIAGLSGYRDFDGEILLRGESIKSLSIDERARRGITLAWQEPARFEGLKVRQFLAAGAKDKHRERLADALQQVGLEPGKYLERAVDKTLSGGERKRIELASILTMEPRIVLMDEPDSGIDIEALDNIFEATQRLKAAGATVIQITHSRTVLRHSEHAFLMCNGQIIDKGGVDRIMQYFENRCIPCNHVNEPAEAETTA